MRVDSDVFNGCDPAKNLPEGAIRGEVIRHPGSSRLLGFYNGEGGDVRLGVIQPGIGRFVPLSADRLESLPIGGLNELESLIEMLEDPEVEATPGLKRLSDLPEGVTGVEVT